MYFKKIIGKRLYLSPIDINDALEYTKWLNDMDVTMGLTLSTSLINEETERNILERLSKEPFNFAVVSNINNNVIGNTGFTKIDYINRFAEVGIFIGDKFYWHNGYGMEALELILDFGFNILNLNNIHLSVFSYNTSAIRCYKKIGFKEAGRIREARIVGNQKFDIIYMDLLASEFKSPYILSVLDRKRGNYNGTNKI